MKNKIYNYSKITLVTALILFMGLSCTRDLDDLQPATYPTSGEVFIDGFSAGLGFDAFGDVTNFEVDKEVKYKGTASMKIAVPDEGATGGFAGGRYYTTVARDLSAYDALTFWIKASKAADIDQLGFGLDGKHQTTLTSLKVNTNWKKVIIPIPDASKLTKETVLFHYFEGPEDGAGYTFWIDELQYESLGTLAHKSPQILNGEDKSESAVNGLKLSVDGLSVKSNLPNGVDQTVNAAPAYFTFTSSDNSVATVDESGMVTVLSAGTSVITARIGEIDAKGSLTITSAGDFVHAPTPTVDTVDVISIFSNHYPNVPVEYYNGYWAPFQTTISADFTVDGDDVLNYANFNFVGIQFTAPTINASNMTHLHMDLWIPNAVDPAAQFLVKAVDLGPDGAFGDPDPSAAVTFTAPDPLVSQNWISLDISLEGMASKNQLAQIILENLGSPLSGFYLDNIYLYNDGGVTTTGPTESAPAPTRDAADVISIYSDVYTDVEGTDFYPDWGQSTVVSEVPVVGNNTLLYTGLNYQGVVLGSSLDVSGMEYLHLDYWTDNSTTLNTFLISEGPEEKAYALSVPTSGWASVDIPLSDFSPVDLMDIIQFKFDGNGNIYLDNIYFYKGGGGSTEPTEAAPEPTHDAANVISVFSDVYMDIAGTDFNPDWGQSTAVTTEDIAGNSTLKYANFNYQGTVLGSTQDASGMQYMHIDMWTADATVVHFTPISAASGEFLFSLTPINVGQWNSYDIPLTAFTDAGVSMNDLIQLKFDGQGGVNPSNIWLDNLYFYKEGGGSTEPTEAAPTPPARDAADVISLFSNEYSNEPVDTWSADWDDSDVADVLVAGDDVKKYTFTNFAGIDFSNNRLDASEMTHFHMDIWTPDEVLSKSLSIKNVDFGGGVEEASSHILTVVHTPSGDIPALATGSWVSIDVPVSAFTGDLTRTDLAQMVLTCNLGTVYMDNIYFYKSGGGSSEPTEAAPAPPARDAADVLSVFSDAYTNINVSDFNPGWGQSTAVTTVDIEGNPTLKYANFNYQGTQFDGAVNASDMQYLHIDMWTADATDVKVTPINGSGAPTEQLVGLTPINTGQWNSYDIPLSDFTSSGMTLNELIQMKFDGQGGVTPSNIWLDNIYFYKDGGGSTEPTVAAPTPPARDAADVLSVFSDAYTNINVSDFNPGWGQSTAVTTVDIAGNPTLQYANFNYQGTVFAGAENASAMQFLHVDMWTADATDVKVTPINSSGSPMEQLVALSPINSGQWNSYDIPLSDFTSSGMTLNELIQMKFDGQGGVTPSNIWLDNIYFYKDGGSTGDWTTNDVIDFEPGGFGAGWTWAVFENGANPPLEFVTNPDASGVNTSATVAKITALQEGQPWVGCETQHGDIGSFSFSADNAIVKIMVYKTVISDVGLKFAENNGEAQPEIKVANTKINEWEELTFDLSGSIGVGATGIIDQIIIFPDFNLSGRTSDNVIYFDNIRFGSE